MSTHGRANSNSGVVRVPECLCGKMGAYDESWDRYYCPDSGVWLEDKCRDTHCQFCSKCPDTHKP